MLDGQHLAGKHPGSRLENLLVSRYLAKKLGIGAGRARSSASGGSHERSGEDPMATLGSFC